MFTLGQLRRLIKDLPDNTKIGHIDDYGIFQDCDGYDFEVSKEGLCIEGRLNPYDEPD